MALFTEIYSGQCKMSRTVTKKQYFVESQRPLVKIIPPFPKTHLLGNLEGPFLAENCSGQCSMASVASRIMINMAFTLFMRIKYFAVDEKGTLKKKLNPRIKENFQAHFFWKCHSKYEEL